MDIQEILRRADTLFITDGADKACDYMEKCYREAEDDWTIRLALANELMGYYRSISRLDTAQRYAASAGEIVTSHNLNETLAGATTLLNISNIYRARKEVSKAMELYNQVERIYKKEGIEDYRLGGLYNNMSVASLETGDKEEAVRYGEAAIEVLKKIPQALDECATVYGNLAGALLQLKEPDMNKIEGYLDRAAEIFENECKNSPHYGAILAMQAYAAYIRNDLDSTLRLYERAMEETRSHYGENADYRRLVQNYNRIRREVER